MTNDQAVVEVGLGRDLRRIAQQRRGTVRNIGATLEMTYEFDSYDRIVKEQYFADSALRAGLIDSGLWDQVMADLTERRRELRQHRPRRFASMPTVHSW